MSIIGEMYEEEIWENSSDLKKRMEEYLRFLVRDKYGDFGMATAFSAAAQKFRELFDKELKWNNGTS